MLTRDTQDKLRRELQSRRKEIFELRGVLENSWQRLHEREIEPEEAAQMEHLSQGMEKLEEQEIAEIDAIDMALRRMASGSYGLCLGCGREISLPRLEAIPWTRFCSTCAHQTEQGPELPSSENAPAPDELPPDFRGLSDTQMELTIMDKIRSDGRVDTRNLTILSRRGVLHLEGTLPDRQMRNALLELVENILGFEDVVDNLRIESSEEDNWTQSGPKT